MSRALGAAASFFAAAGICWAARCTTVLDPRVLSEYNNYVVAAEQAMSGPFDTRELSWMPGRELREAAASLASGKLVRSRIGDASLNQRIAGQNGTVIHWIGAIRVHGSSLSDLKSVLEDYDSYDRIYRPMVFGCRAKRNGEGAKAVYDVTLGLHNTYRFASLFPQHFAFRVRARVDHSSTETRDGAALQVHLRASEIRESDSGVPGRSDFLEPYHDHGIMWALNAYWRARQCGTGLYLEFETITLARSVQAFACKIGFFPVPKSVVSGAMDSLPVDSLTVILKGTRAECERRTLRSTRSVSGP